MNLTQLKRNLINKIEDEERYVRNLEQKIKDLESKNVELEENLNSKNRECTRYTELLYNMSYVRQEKLADLEKENYLLKKQLECEKRATEDICIICAKYGNAFNFPCCNQKTCHVCADEINKSDKCPYCRSTKTDNFYYTE